MIAVVTNLGSLRSPAAVRGWARTIAVRESLRVEGAPRAVPMDPHDIARFAAPDVSAGVDVLDALRRLRPEHRAVLVLREVEGLSEAETAAALGVSVGTVKSRTSRAKDAFVRRWPS